MRDREVKKQKAEMNPHNPKHRVSLESVATVLTYTAPALQRGIDEDHVNRMVEDQVAEHAATGALSLLQSITVACMGGRYFVLDGQHRIRTFQELRARGLPVDCCVVPVVSYAVRDAEELGRYFGRINQHKPVHPLELREGWQHFERPFLQWLTARAKPYLKNGVSRTRCPHIGVEQLKTELQAREEGLRRPTGGDPQVLCEAVRQFDAHVAAIYATASIASDSPNSNPPGIAFSVRMCTEPSQLGKRLADCAAKVKGNACYLGAFRHFEWLDVCVFSMNRMRLRGAQNTQNGDIAILVPFETVQALVWAQESAEDRGGTKRPRAAIPYDIRQRVWDKTNPPSSVSGACYTCGQELRFRDMECGHVVAHALGGGTEVGNLMAVCRSCNRDMGVQDMEAYRGRIRAMRQGECRSVHGGAEDDDTVMNG